MCSGGVVVITTTQLHSTEPELRFYAGSNPARGLLEICDGKDLRQWSLLEINAKGLSSVTHTTKTIHHHHVLVQIYLRRIYIIYSSTSASFSL